VPLLLARLKTRRLDEYGSLQSIDDDTISRVIFIPDFAQFGPAWCCTVKQLLPRSPLRLDQNINDLTCPLLATNQGVVGSNPAGRAKINGLRSCSPFLF
jgi:hypothetical protein